METLNIDAIRNDTVSLAFEYGNVVDDEGTLDHISFAQYASPAQGGTGNGIRATARWGESMEADVAAEFNFPTNARADERLNTPERLEAGLMFLEVPTNLEVGDYPYQIEGETADGDVVLWFRGRLRILEDLA